MCSQTNVFTNVGKMISEGSVTTENYFGNTANTVEIQLRISVSPQNTELLLFMHIRKEGSKACSF